MATHEEFETETETETIVAFVKRAAKFIDESTTLTEQFICFLCFYVLFPHFSLQSVLSIWFMYFAFSVFSTFALDEINVSADGWKEKCSFKKFGIVIGGVIVEESGYKTGDLFDNLRDIIQRKAPRLLGLYDLVVAPDGSEGVNQDTYTQVDNDDDDDEEEDDDADDLVSDDQSSLEDFDEEDYKNLEKQEELDKDRAIEVALKLTDWLGDSRMQIKDLKKDLDLQTSTACNLKDQLEESRDMEAELMSRNAKLYEKLCQSEAKCKQLNNSLIMILVSKKELQKQVNELKDHNSALLEETRLALITEFDMAEKHKLEIFNLNKTIEELEVQKNEQLLSVEARNAKDFREMSSEYEEQIKFESAELNETIYQLETETQSLRAQLSLEAELQKLMESKLIKNIQELESDNEELLARLSVEAYNAEHFRALSSEYENQLNLEKAKLKETSEELQTEKYIHSVTSKGKKCYEIENNELNEIISELKDEKSELTTKLTNALSTIKHFETESMVYKDAMKSQEQENDILRKNLQNANDTAEFHNKLLNLEYDIV